MHLELSKSFVNYSSQTIDQVALWAQFRHKRSNYPDVGCHMSEC